MEEFGSELPLPAEPKPVEDESPASNAPSRDESAFHVVLVIAIVEAAMLIVAGFWLSGFFGVATGTIVIDSVPAAAEVLLDGTVAGVTPLSLSLAEGRHVIKVRHDDKAQAITVPVRGGETTHSLVEFVPPQSHDDASSEIRISSEPAAAQVSLDGIVRGATPLVVPDLTPGSHIVSVRSRNGQASHSIVVADGQPQSLHVLLPDTTVGPGSISIAVATPLRVFAGNRLLGTTGTGPIALAAGIHELDLVNEELGVRLHERVTVRPGITTFVTPSLPQLAR